MKHLLIAVAVLVVLLVAWAVMRPADAPLPFALPDPPPAAPVGDGMPLPATPTAATGDAPAGEYDDIELDEEAIASLRGGILFGDPRTPPIERSPAGERASAEELADPALYAEYETRQEKKLKRAYVIEAEKYVAQLRSDVERGRAGGIPPDEIAKVEKKIKGIEEMRAKLLRDDPDLLGGNGQAPGN